LKMFFNYLKDTIAGKSGECWPTIIAQFLSTSRNQC
jgi:hypothetical protein